MPVADDTYAYRGDLPHLSKRGKTYLLTFCTWRRIVMNRQARDIVLSTVLHDRNIEYALHAAVIMPEHVHILLTPIEKDERAMSTIPIITQRLKSVSAHRVARLPNQKRHVWQDESFDHIVRGQDSLRAKADYICENPVRRGLVKAPDDWPWLWRWWVEGSR
ncbi:MAG: transposase [Thermoanaerobaculia bacterium]|nr:transposase [Thermoanaerobaculia bacterium]